VTRCDERGAATAELALSIPLLVSLTVGLVWLLSIGVAQVQMVDAAREAARATARGDPLGEAVSRGQQVAPGATVTVTLAGGSAVATASGDVPPPGGLLGFLPHVHLQARAVTAAEAP
jgi:Flp pilus assembly protein TadG